MEMLSVITGALFFPQKILNPTKSRVPEVDATALAQQLHKVILKIYSKFLNEEGSAVDYEGIAASDEFIEFEETTSLLHLISLGDFSELERKVLFLNLYNTCMIHGRIRYGTPPNFLSRNYFFSEVGYMIGEHFYSLNDMENGILRNNSASATGSVSFKTNDPRSAYTVPLDPRIHFALVCGAKSCPPIRIYSIENCETALNLATKNFCTHNTKVSSTSKSVTVSMLFKWYASDFGSTPERIIEFISHHTPEDLTSQLQNLPKSLKLKYFSYDWTSNSI